MDMIELDGFVCLFACLFFGFFLNVGLERPHNHASVGISSRVPDQNGLSQA